MFWMACFLQTFGIWLIVMQLEIQRLLYFGYHLPFDRTENIYLYFKILYHMLRPKLSPLLEYIFVEMNTLLVEEVKKSMRFDSCNKAYLFQHFNCNYYLYFSVVQTIWINIELTLLTECSWPQRMDNAYKSSIRS